MKIIHINVSDDYGGAAKAAYRIHRALKTKSITSEFWVQSKVKREDVIAPSTRRHKITSFLRPYIDKLPLQFSKLSGPFSLSWFSSSKLVERINNSNADIIHLHRINDGYLSVGDLAKIKKPLIWTLHDSWPFTGGCHIINTCTQYQRHCQMCPVLTSNTKKDFSYYIFKNKLHSYVKIPNISIVGVSEWMKDNAKKSRLFSNEPIFVIGNPIDTQVFSPIEKAVAKSILNLPAEPILILFGAVNATSDENKGFKYLKQAFENLDSDLYKLIIFGDDKNSIQQELVHNVINFGKVMDEVTLKVLYSAADIVVVPSIQESFGQTATEAMSCGTPVVAFRTSGLLDIIDHQKNGYLAEPYKAVDLANGIKWVIENNRQGDLGKRARIKIFENFRLDIIASKYLEVYNQLLSAESRRGNGKS